MDKELFAKRWPEIQPGVRARWGRLSDRELDGVQGNAEILIGLIQEKYEEPRKAIEMQLGRLVEPQQPEAQIER